MIGLLLNKTLLGVMAGLASAAIVSYCVYFDNKRRNHPEFKKNLYDRRRRNKKSEDLENIPNLTDQSSTERYFLEELRKGEVFITEGNLELGAVHLMNAVVVCGRPVKLLNFLQSTLPAEVFALLLHKLNHFNNTAMRGPNVGDNLMTGLVVDEGGVE